MSNRGRPKTTNSQLLARTKECKEKSKNQTALALCFLLWNKIVTNRTKLSAEIKDSAFNWISFLPKDYYENQQDLMQDLKSQGFKQIFKCYFLLALILSARGMSFKVIIKEFASICEDFLLAMKQIASPQIASPQQALNEVRRYYQKMELRELDVRFKYMRFNVVGILQETHQIIKQNILYAWKYYILILTKLVYVVYQKTDIGNLIEMFKSGAANEDAFQQEMSFFQIGKQQLRQHLKALQQAKALSGSSQKIQEDEQENMKYLLNASQRDPKKDRSQMPTGTGVVETTDLNQLQSNARQNSGVSGKYSQMHNTNDTKATHQRTKGISKKKCF